MKLPAAGYLLLFLFACVFVAACSQTPRVPKSEPVETGQALAIATPTADQTETPMMPGRRASGDPLAQVLDIEMLRLSDEPTSLQMPSVIEATIAGRNINSIVVVAGRHEDDSSRRLVMVESLESGYAEQVWPVQWPDGIHNLPYVWYTEGDYLGDGITGDFALLWSIEPGNSLKTINGRFRRSEDSEYLDSVLMVDTSSGLASELLDVETGEVLLPQPGDQFQLMDLLLDDFGATVSDPGTNLTFGESAQLVVERRTLSPGDYFLGFVAEGGPSNADSVFTNYTVSNENLLPGLRAYLQPELGYQFMYPADWSESFLSKQGVLFDDESKNIQLQIAVNPSAVPGSISKIKREVLDSFGDIQVLYEDQVQIGSSNGQRTVYGYESPTGPHTGLLLSFAHDGREFVVDVDGPLAEEATVLDVMETLIDSWLWRSILDNNQVAGWESFDIDGYQVDVPEILHHNLLGNGWHRFSAIDGDAFFAIRIESQAAADKDELMTHWLDVASRDISSFISSDVYEFKSSDQSWLRVDFQYNDEEGGELWGAILATESDGDDVVAWFEAPESDYAYLEENLVTLSLADLLNQ